MSWFAVIFVAVLCAICVASLLHTVLALAYAQQWRKEKLDVETSDETLPPLTVLRPIKAGVPGLREKLVVLAQAMRVGDRLVLGVNDGSDDVAVAGSVRAEFAEREIAVVRCRDGAALNPKISKLMQMETAAAGEHLLLNDSEAIIDAAWLDAFRREWAASSADVMTCGYRFAGATSWTQSLCAAPTLFSLWPGLLFVRRFGRIHFTLGACTGLRRGDLASAGGWAAFADDLAEDNRLGAALAKAGKTIRLSQQVATLESDPLTWREYWRHQRRVAVTYRVCNPAGFAGMIFTHSVWASLLLVVFPSFEPLVRIVLLFAFMILQWMRWFFFRELAKSFRFSRARLFPAMLISDVIATLCWLLAWFSPTVWWAGKWWRVSHDGKLREA